jgi:hypothetical protein
MKQAPLLPKGRLARDRRGFIDGAISPLDGCASIALPQWRRCDFLPLGFAHSSRRQESRLPCHPALRSGPDGCVVDRLRPLDRHRDRGGRGLGQPGRNHMATIGTFERVGDSEYLGDIFTLSLRARILIRPRWLSGQPRMSLLRPARSAK